MTIKCSTALANKILDTASFDALWTTPEIRIYSGSVPATADLDAGTVIATVQQGGGALTFAASAAGGVLSKSASAWTDASVSPGGVATYYRLVNTADDDSDNTGVDTYPRVQGTVGTGGTDMVVGTTTIASSSVFTVDYWTVALIPT